MSDEHHKEEQKKHELFCSREKSVVGNEATKSGPKLLESASIMEK